MGNQHLYSLYFYPWTYVVHIWIYVINTDETDIPMNRFNIHDHVDSTWNPVGDWYVLCNLGITWPCLYLCSLNVHNWQNPSGGISNCFHEGKSL